MRNGCFTGILLLVAVCGVATGITLAYHIYIPAPQSCYSVAQKTIRGYSMEPRLYENNTIQVLMQYYDCHDVERGDVVLAENPAHPDGLIVKNVKAIPNDTLRFVNDAEGWHIVVNDIILTNIQGIPYVFSESRIQLLKSYDTVGSGVIQSPWYLLMGEVPEGSFDSSRYGLFSKDMIVGKVVMP